MTAGSLFLGSLCFSFRFPLEGSSIVESRNAAVTQDIQNYYEKLGTDREVSFIPRPRCFKVWTVDQQNSPPLSGEFSIR